MVSWRVLVELDKFCFVTFHEPGEFTGGRVVGEAGADVTFPGRGDMARCPIFTVTQNQIKIGAIIIFAVERRYHLHVGDTVRPGDDDVGTTVSGVNNVIEDFLGLNDGCFAREAVERTIFDSEAVQIVIDAGLAFYPDEVIEEPEGAIIVQLNELVTSIDFVLVDNADGGFVFARTADVD